MSVDIVVAVASDLAAQMTFPVSIDVIAKAHKVTVNRRFRTQVLWPAIELFRERTGRQLVQCRGDLVLLTPEEALTHSRGFVRKAIRKKERAIDIVTKVDPGDDARLRRRRDRFLDRVDASRATDKTTIIDMAEIEKQQAALDQRRLDLAAKRKARRAD